ncbi:hypothetical protein F4801DRAFT_597060 [Xylaria longipes]|nr:hypothetical protein F4801DRAFT_597060 [Xylaria longipes]
MMDISRDITAKMVQATGNTNLIVLPNRNYDAWYPNWFDRKTWTHTRLSGPSATPRVFADSHKPKYRASGDVKAQLSFSGNLPIIQGFSLGQVLSCSPTLKEAKASGLPKTYIVEKRTWKPGEDGSELLFTEAGGKKAQGRRPQDPHITESLRWLLVDFNTSNDQDDRRSFGLLHRLLSRRKRKIRLYSPYLLQWMNCCEEQSFTINGQPFVGYFSQKNDKYSTPPDVFRSICEAFQSNLEHEMRLCTLTTDRLGWVPKDTMVGDKVFILLGSSMPCVLSKRMSTSPCHKIVGPCHIDGAMFGKLVEDGMQKLQDIQLG